METSARLARCTCMLRVCILLALTTSATAGVRVEQTSRDAADGGLEYQVTIADDTSHAALPELALGVYGTTATVGFESQLHLAPGDAWLFREQKIAHGVGGAYLYRRVKGAVFVASAKPRVDLTVKTLFGKLAGARRPADEMGIVEFVEWTRDRKAMVVALRGRDVSRFDVVDWRCTVDLATGRAHVTAAQARANRGTFHRSSR